MKVILSIVIGIGCCGLITTPSQADTPSAEKDQLRKWMELYSAQAKDYELNLIGTTEHKLQLHPTPVIRWTNPVTGNGTTHGACFVWTHRGRPEAFASLFSYIPSRRAARDKRTVAHAFNSFAVAPLIGKRQGAAFWNPRKPGAEFKPLADAAMPAKSPAARLVQMRNLAREFNATGSLNGSQSELRLLTQPVYRYNSSRPDILDGALFAFVTGTDPELLLLIEARQTESDFQWHFAAARHSHFTLRLHHKDVEVWSYVRGGPHSRAKDPTHHYLSIHGIEILDSVIE